MWIQRNFSERFAKIAPITVRAPITLTRQSTVTCIHFAAFRMGYFWPFNPGMTVG
jgi:hypothetical protein